MAKLCMVGYTYRGYEMAHAFDRAKQFGYDGIELRNFSDIDFSTPAGVRSSLSKAVELAADVGLTIISLFYSPLPISRTHEGEREEQTFCQVIETLAEYQVPILHTRLRLKRMKGAGEVVAADATEQDYKAVQAALERVVPIAEAQDVRIALETHMGTIHDTAASQLRIVETIDSPFLVASLDFANMLITYREENLLETIRAFGYRIGYVHAKNLKLTPWGYDWNLPLRWGDINYHRVLEGLKAVSYRGTLAVEYCGTGDPDVFAADDAAYLKSLCEQIGL